jgi:hypothetical protein
MHYDKGKQLTVGELRRYLSIIPEDVKISIGLGDNTKSLHYFSKEGDELVLSHDIYMTNAWEHNLETLINFSGNK